MDGLKCLLLVPKRYPFIQSVISGMEAQGIQTKAVDYRDFFSGTVNRWVAKYTNLPKKITRYWEKPYVDRINAAYLDLVRAYSPDVVFVYNNQLAQPEFFEQIKGKTKIVFLLGDNPLYTHTSSTNLHILYYADYIICPDSMWRDQLHTMGVRHISLDWIGFSEEVFYPMDVTEAEKQQYGSDLVYFGNAYKSNWGYKRARFLNIFKDLNLKAFMRGDGMERWYPFFPGLRQRVVPLQPEQTFNPAFTNLAYNCSKIAPIERVPSFFKGVHVRVFDALGSGILPLCETSEDLDHLFPGLEVPIIRHYQEGAELASYWLQHEAERQATIARMRKRVQDLYAPERVVERMYEHTFSSSAQLS